ncbi:MAG: hypothetical protein HRU70_14965 [Phycisphaeraceae bacterium]|nr:MAG: hypothetical protein HRU70_14965 [Phycisphaeraceae bacterium]
MTRRGAVMMLVLLVVTMGAAAALSVLTGAVGVDRGVSHTSDRVRSRALAWSGLQAVMSELAAQRAAILRGEDPTLTARHEFGAAGGRVGVAKLIPFPGDEPSGPGEREALAASEGSKIDLNRADESMLAGIASLGEAGAKAVVAGRNTRAWSSVEELATLPSVSLAALYGRPETGEGAASERAGAPRGGSAAASMVSEDAPLTNLLTAFSFDPTVRAGVAGGSGVGLARVPIAGGWNEAMGGALSELMGGQAEAMKRVLQTRRAVTSSSAFVGLLREMGVPKDSWAAALDLFTPWEDEFVPGLIDVNRASVGVLSLVPGLSAESAAAIAGRREGLDAAAKSSIAWIARLGVISDDEFQAASDWLTHRTTQWRVRVEAGFDREGQDDPVPGAAGVGLEGRVVWEAVIDVADDRPRLAYLRDVTHLGLALAMERVVSAGEPRADLDDGTDEALPEAGPSGPGEGMEDVGSLRLRGMRDRRMSIDAGLDLEGPGAEVKPAEADAGGAGTGSTSRADRRAGRWRAGGRER